MTPPDITLVTGFPAFAARRLAAQLLESDPQERVFMLAQKKFSTALETFIRTLPATAQKRVEVLIGDVIDMDLGLTGRELNALTRDLTAIHHTAAVSYLGTKSGLMRRVNVEGTRAILELGSECQRLRRLIHWSTAQVSGRRSGVILEDELDLGQRFSDAYEETKFAAELLVHKAMRRLPITVLRPGIVVGDSHTGEIDRFLGPYYLMRMIITSPLDVSLPLPGRGDGPLNLVPIDFVVAAAAALGRDERARGGTFHLTDPCPLAARTVYELVAERADKKLPRGVIPTRWAQLLLRVPVVRRLAHVPLSFLQSFDHPAVYSARQALSLLDGTGIICPPFDSYVDKLVTYVQKRHRERGDETSDVGALRKPSDTARPHDPYDDSPDPESPN